MFRSKTVFVVGAGASREAGLPTGTELRPVIASKLDIRYKINGELISGNREIADALRGHAQKNGEDVNSYLLQASKISEAMPQAISIDSFIDAHRGDASIELCGKLAIAQAILEAEGNSKLYFADYKQERFDPKKLSGTWYENFFQLLTENVRLEDLKHIFDNISFIVFNYDRCIEHFLYHSLRNYYCIADRDAGELLEQLRISHPYGSVGRLPWQAEPSKGVAFGSKPPGTNFLGIASQIKTFTERAEDESARDAIRSHIQEANTIVFLGFAFHPLNLELITPELPSDATRVFGTAMRMSSEDLFVVEHDISQMLKSNALEISVNNALSCSSLFEYYWRSLSRR